MNALTWLQTRIKQTAVTAGELLFPPACAVCGETVESSASNAPLFCLACRHDLWPGTGSFCPRCAMPCPDLPNPTGTCPECRERKPAFDAARTIGVYQLAIREAVLRIKHAAFEPLAIQLGKLLAERIRRECFSPAPDVIVPVPMHWLKRLWRGTSAAETLAQSLSSELRLPCLTDVVRCQRLLKKQSLLPAGQRYENVRGAYGIGWGFDLRGANVLLVDDVITTGSTCHVIARELKQAGAAHVYVAAVARTTAVF